MKCTNYLASLNYFIIHNCVCMYLISPFRITTAQTREFPITLVMTSVDITVVIAMSANSYMIQGVSLDREI